MSLRHGNKRYYQLLLDPNRASMLQRTAEDLGKRETEMIREIVYTWLYQHHPEWYEEEKGKDDVLWRQSVRNRVKGREKARQSRELGA